MCFRCKKEREMTNPKIVYANGKKRVQGTCNVCAGQISRFLSSTTK